MNFETHCIILQTKINLPRLSLTKSISDIKLAKYRKVRYLLQAINIFIVKLNIEKIDCSNIIMLFNHYFHQLVVWWLQRWCQNMLHQNFAQASGSLQLEGTSKYKNDNKWWLLTRLSWLLLSLLQQILCDLTIWCEFGRSHLLKQKILKALLIQITETIIEKQHNTAITC